MAGAVSRRCGWSDDEARRWRSASPASCCCAARRCSPATSARPSKTAEAMTADGWLRTGDLAMRDARRRVPHLRAAQGDVHLRRRERVPRRGGGGAARTAPAWRRRSVVACPTRSGARWAARSIVARGAWRRCRRLASLLPRARGWRATRCRSASSLWTSCPRLGSGKVDRANRAAAGPVTRFGIVDAAEESRRHRRRARRCAGRSTFLERLAGRRWRSHARAAELCAPAVADALARVQPTEEMPYATLFSLWHAADAELGAESPGVGGDRRQRSRIESLGMQLYGGILRKARRASS